MKKMNKKGFTLMEMLIVIAIIAILIAIAIPTFTAALEKSRQKTDLANARSLKSLVVAAYMAAEPSDKSLVDAINGANTGTVAVYLSKDGQGYVYADPTEATCMKLTATKWKSTNNLTESKAAGYVALEVDNKCIVQKSNPDIKGNLPS